MNIPSEFVKYISDIQSALLTRFSFYKRDKYARTADLRITARDSRTSGPASPPGGATAKMQEMHQKLGIAQTSILRVQFESSGLQEPGLSMVVMQRNIFRGDNQMSASLVILY